MNNYYFKIIEEETPEKAEYEMNDFIEYCNEEDIEILDITSHVIVNQDDYYSYIFIIKYRN